jgi:plasmid stabilization system protein ParE
VKVRSTRAARGDLQQAARYYDQQRDGLGDEFRDEVRSTIERIARNPKACKRLDDDFRQCRTRRFPYGIIYRAAAEEVVIIAIFHLHRRPGSWRDRP